MVMMMMMMVVVVVVVHRSAGGGSTSNDDHHQAAHPPGASAHDICTSALHAASGCRHGNRYRHRLIPLLLLMVPSLLLLLLRRGHRGRGTGPRDHGAVGARPRRRHHHPRALLLLLLLRPLGLPSVLGVPGPLSEGGGRGSPWPWGPWRGTAPRSSGG